MIKLFIKLDGKQFEDYEELIRIILLPIAFPIALGKHIYDFTWDKISKMFH